MNKQDTAAALQITVRTLQRYTAQGKISSRQERGKTGMVTVYDADEVDRFRSELEGATGYVRPTVTPNAPVTVNNATPGETALTLARSGNSPALIELIDALMAVGKTTPPADSISDLAQKLMLTEKEASRYSGLPLAEIKAARKTLKARIIGKGYKLKRETLEAWVKKL
jgi:hypothetical protein